MKKSTKIVAAVVVVVIALVVGIVLITSKPKTKLEPVSSAEDLSALVDKIYEGQDIQLSLMTQTLDVSDDMTVQAFTGLENGQDLEYLVASEPMMSSQAYSLILAKVKDGVDANQVAKAMSENVDTRKWICVTAEKLYATNSDDIICLVMSSETTAKPIYEKFKTLAGATGKEYEKTAQESELPADMY